MRFSNSQKHINKNETLKNIPQFLKLTTYNCSRHDTQLYFHLLHRLSIRAIFTTHISHEVVTIVYIIAYK